MARRSNLKIYNVEYKIERIVEREKFEGALDCEFEDSEEELEEVIIDIQMGGDNFFGVTFEATEMLSKAFGEKEYELLGIQEIPNVEIMNWPGENSPCDCPVCKAKEMSDEDVMMFTCPDCNKNIRVAHGEWEGINCPHCGEIILQDNIIDLGKNQYKAIKIEEKKG
jgi:hypothetical protein